MLAREVRVMLIQRGSTFAGILYDTEQLRVFLMQLRDFDTYTMEASNTSSCRDG